MAEKVVQIKNVSRGNFYLTLDFVKEGKYFDMKPDTIVHLTFDEYSYLETQCKGAFEKGFLKVVNVDNSVKDTLSVVETENEMSDEDISKLMEVPLATFKKRIKDVTSLHLIKDIRTKADEVGKTGKFMEAIDARIDELADGSKLL